MSVDQFESDRHFQLWIYSVSHSQLLLRSNRSSEEATRIDVLFKDVAAIELPTSFDGLSIAMASGDETSELRIQLGTRPILDQKTFIVRGRGFVGYVVASVLFWHQDEGHHFDESYFQKSFMPSTRL
jgi:hypothetical protein